MALYPAPSLGHRNHPAYEDAAKSGLLHLISMNLTDIPAPALRLSSLVRLDLGFNAIVDLTPEVSQLANLQELWLNGNPLRMLPKELEHCRRLEMLDLRDTQLEVLPFELGRLERLHEVDMRGAPLNEHLRRYVGDTEGLIGYLAYSDKLEGLKVELFDKISAGIYREVADSELGKLIIPQLVEAVSLVFRDLDEYRGMVRNSDRLFPPDLKTVVVPERAASKVRHEYIEMKADNERRRAETARKGHGAHGKTTKRTGPRERKALTSMTT
mmetsp:Transcript_39009/g.122169  ORF Transcript_39009/g.122169 Transcript_39009/m.122169 type:complete len:270 (-) Transcript_39009:26-835(-)